MARFNLVAQNQKGIRCRSHMREHNVTIRQCRQRFRQLVSVAGGYILISRSYDKTPAIHVTIKRSLSGLSIV